MLGAIKGPSVCPLGSRLSSLKTSHGLCLSATVRSGLHQPLTSRHQHPNICMSVGEMSPAQPITDFFISCYLSRYGMLSTCFNFLGCFFHESWVSVPHCISPATLGAPRDGMVFQKVMVRAGAVA